jgi:hypothetical protein
MVGNLGSRQGRAQLTMTGDDIGEFPLVTIADFEDCPFEAPIARLNQINMPTISLTYQQAAAVNTGPCAKVYGLLSAVCGIHLNPAERATVWIPGSSFGNRRTLIPSDVRGTQSDVLEVVLGRAKHPALRARLADVVWSNDLRKGAMAKVAIEAYCECVEGLISGTLAGC